MDTTKREMISGWVQSIVCLARMVNPSFAFGKAQLFFEMVSENDDAESAEIVHEYAEAISRDSET